MLNKKYLIIAIILIIFVIVIINITGKSNKETTIIENNIAKTDVKLEEVEFKEITKVYENGITTISAKMNNTTKNTKNITVKIILKDEKGKELTNTMQIVENLEPGKIKILSTGLSGDYTKVTDIKFEIVK